MPQDQQARAAGDYPEQQDDASNNNQRFHPATS